MSKRVHMKHRARTKAGYINAGESQGSHCINCGRKLPTRHTVCRKLKGCPGRVMSRLMKGEVLDPNHAR